MIVRYSRGALAFLLLVCTLASAATPWETFQVYRFLDQNNNLPAAAWLTQLSAAEKLEALAPYFEVPLADLPKLGLSQPSLHFHPSDDAAQFFLIPATPNAGPKIRIFEAALATEDVTKFYIRYPRLTGEFWQTKLLSHATHVIRNSLGKAIIIKPTTNTPSVVVGALANLGFKLSRQGLLEEPMQHEEVPFAFVHEHEIIQPLNHFLRIDNFIIRSVAPFAISPANDIAIPLHAIRTKLMQKIAQGQNMMLDEWIVGELMPALGRAFARLNYAYGLSGSLHTQNIILRVNPHTGKLRKILFRDFSDITVNPQVMFFKKQFRPLKFATEHGYALRRLGSAADFLWTRRFFKHINAEFHNPDHAAITSFYTLGVVASWTVGKEWVNRSRYTFFKSYVAGFRAQVGVSPFPDQQLETWYHQSTEAAFPYLPALQKMDELVEALTLAKVSTAEVNHDLRVADFARWQSRSAKQRVVFDQHYTAALSELFWRGIERVTMTGSLLKNLRTLVDAQGTWYVRWDAKSKEWKRVAFVSGHSNRVGSRVIASRAIFAKSLVIRVCRELLEKIYAL